ncbi:MAG: hypothetical protein WKG00_28215 [Polyangiaceae bacterium]
MSEESARPGAGSHGGGAPAEGLPQIDVSERGALRDGQPQQLDRRLFMQLLVFTASGTGSAGELPERVGRAVAERGAPVVVYADVNDPRGIGVLTWSEDPALFVTAVRPALDGLRDAWCCGRR